MASIYDTHKPAAGEGGGLYLKIQDGETVKLRIASEPAIFETEGELNGQKVLSTRYGWVVYNQDAKAAQILQQGPRFFKNIAGYAQDEEWGDPTGYDIKVKREGTGLETTYTITPSTNRDPLDDSAQDAVKAIDLLEKLKASPFSQRVMWLSDHDKMSAEGRAASKERAVQVGSSEPEDTAADETPAQGGSLLNKTKKDDVVIDNIGDEPINLDDIPF